MRPSQNSRAQPGTMEAGLLLFGIREPFFSVGPLPGAGRAQSGCAAADAVVAVVTSVQRRLRARPAPDLFPCGGKSRRKPGASAGVPAGAEGTLSKCSRAGRRPTGRRPDFPKEPRIPAAFLAIYRRWGSQTGGKSTWADLENLVLGCRFFSCLGTKFPLWLF